MGLNERSSKKEVMENLYSWQFPIKVKCTNYFDESKIGLHVLQNLDTQGSFMYQILES